MVEPEDEGPTDESAEIARSVGTPRLDEEVASDSAPRN
jgi:hypothetical protein